jgi:CheY-like chemotaxis protein
MQPYVLMIEDDKDDRYLTEETLGELNIEIPIKFLADSSNLFEYLSSATKPSLILMDYNVVPENSISILKKLKHDEKFRTIPVVILSENNLPQYKKECYEAGASSFIKKPETIEGTKQKIASFFNYWFEVAEL